MIKLNSHFKIFAGVLVLAAVYVVTGVLGNYLAVPPGYATVFWPPSGFALAAVYLCGYWLSIGVFLGAFIVNALNASDFLNYDQFFSTSLTAFVISIGAALQALVGANLIKKCIGSHTRLESLRDILKFSFLAGPISCLIACSVGVITLIFNGVVGLSDFPYTWMNWYVGDVLGVLIFAPILIILFADQSVSRNRKIYTIFPLLFIFAIVISGFFYVKEMDKNVRIADFRSNVELISQEIDHSVEEHFGELKGFLALYESSQDVNREEFDIFAKNTVDRTLTAGIAYVPLLTEYNKLEFQNILQQNGMEDFQLKDFSGETHNKRCFPYCVPVLFVYPFEKYQNVVGLDLNGEETRITTIREAIAQQSLQISGPVILANTEKLGFIAVQPIPSKNPIQDENTLDKIAGFVVNGSLYEELFGSFLMKWQAKGLRLKVTDKDSGVVIYKDADKLSGDQSFVVEFKKEIAGRSWVLQYYLSDSYILASANWSIWFALAASLLVAFLVSVFLLAVTGQTAAIETIVNQKTKEISDKNSFLKIIMDSVPDLIFVKNEKSEIVQCNKGFLKQFSPEKRNEITGRVPYEHFPEHEANIFKQHDKIAFEQGYSETNQRNTDYQGITRDYFARKIRFETEDGTPYILAVGRDITDEKQMLENLKQSEQRFRASLENAPIGMSLVDMDQNWIVFNKSLCQSLGYNEEEFAKKSLLSLTHPDDLKKDAEELKQLIKGDIDSYSIEKRYFMNGGGYAWVLLTLALVRDDNDEPLYFVAHTLDITERKQMEGELRRSNEELEQFAYVASHDLKAPLRHISLSAGFLSEQYKDKLDANALEMIAIMTQGAERMQNMIESLLEYSRVGQKGAGSMEEVKFSDIIKVAKEQLKPLIDETDAKISVKGAKVVLNVHKILLEQLFQNLIQNALKYKKDDVAPIIKLDATKGKSAITITICDNGIGIDEKHSRKIFDVFQRLHAEGQYEGMGIGLAICKRIVEAHNGEIWLDADYSDGCKFIIKLPVV